ncbi:XRE family transcriptional regulator [Robbsia andropogonis]|uniref:XRE family transcriptional regulator n=1 Tax=Robbsia andropogonis TaxID=28092 RepID=UPI003D1C9567
MRDRTNLVRHLEITNQSNRGKRAFAARLNATLKRSGFTSSRLAKALQVAENVVEFWRRGVVLPDLNDCRRLCEILQLDVLWLCDASENVPRLNEVVHRVVVRRSNTA